jgi:hypothetical protein
MLDKLIRAEASSFNAWLAGAAIAAGGVDFCIGEFRSIAVGDMSFIDPDSISALPAIDDDEDWTDLENMLPSHDELIASAKKHRAPQEWYDEDHRSL